MGLLKDIWKNKDLIVEGIRNKTFPPEELKEIIIKTAMSRKMICEICPFMSENAKVYYNYKSMRFDNHCTKCGCNIDLKTNSLSSSCPDNPSRWNAIVSEDDFSNIQQTIKEHEEGISQTYKDSSASGNIKEL